MPGKLYGKFAGINDLVWAFDGEHIAMSSPSDAPDPSPLRKCLEHQSQRTLPDRNTWIRWPDNRSWGSGRSHLADEVQVQHHEGLCLP